MNTLGMLDHAAVVACERGQQALIREEFAGLEEPIGDEIKVWLSSPTSQVRTLDLLFPDGVRVTPTFYETLLSFWRILGFREEVAEVVGHLILGVAKEQPVSRREELLLLLTSIEATDLFVLLPALPPVIRGVELDPGFVLDWFSSLAEEVGDDLANYAFWKNVNIYGNEFPCQALLSARTVGVAANRWTVLVRARLLGLVRANTIEKVNCCYSSIQQEADVVSKALKESEDFDNKRVYFLSWVEISNSGRLNCQMFIEILNEIDQITTESLNIDVVTRILLGKGISADCVEIGMEWLRSKAKPEMTASDKHVLLNFASRCVFNMPEHAIQTTQIVASILPISIENIGSWHWLEICLTQTLRVNRLAFVRLFMSLAQIDPEGLKKAMDNRTFENLMHSMEEAGLNGMVTELIMSDQQSLRRIGLALFDKLEISSLDYNKWKNVDRRKAVLILLQTITAKLDGASGARILCELIDPLESADTEFRHLFREQIYIQLVNFPGSARNEFSTRRQAAELVQDIIKETETYFRELKIAGDSPCARIGVPGLKRASRIYSRVLSGQVSKVTDETSVLRRMAKRTHILYGNGWRNSNNGQLGDKSQFHDLSTTIEMPRMELSDPEGMILRRLFAYHRISEIEEVGIEGEPQS